MRGGGGDAAEASPAPQGGSQEQQQGVQGVGQQKKGRSLLFDTHVCVCVCARVCSWKHIWCLNLCVYVHGI